MKKNLLLLLFITLSTMSFSQKDLSLTIGANRSNVIWTNLEEIGWKHKMGYFIGLRNSYLKTKKIELSSELQFSNKGWENTNNKQNYKYLDVLHSVTYKPIKLAGIFVGFNTAYLISNKNKQIIDTNFDLGVLPSGQKVNLYIGQATTNRPQSVGQFTISVFPKY